MRIRGRTFSKVFLAILLLAPVIVFFGILEVSGRTRSGSVDEVWFVRAPGGPRLIARDQLPVGSEMGVAFRHRLVLVDLESGERLARRKVDAALELIGVDRSGFWFRRRGDGADVHLRNALTLERIDPAGATPPPALPPGKEVGVVDAATLPGGAQLTASGLDSARFPEAAFVAGTRTGTPLLLTDPPSALVVSRDGEGIAVSRVDAHATELWRAKLEKQRGVRSASRVGEVVVLVTSGAARDFAIALDVGSGGTKWVHSF